MYDWILDHCLCKSDQILILFDDPLHNMVLKIEHHKFIVKNYFQNPYF